MSDKIRLPFQLSIVIKQQLRDKHGINKFADMRDEFTSDELALIKSLSIQNPGKGVCKGLSLLPNLCHLSIQSTGNNAYRMPKDISSIDDNDVDEIAKCKQLQSLEIINQNHVTEIDLSPLTKLYDINISRNTNLETIIGLDKQPELSFLTCYGNNSLKTVQNLDKCIAGASDLSELKLDVLLFPQAIGHKSDGSYNQQAVQAMEVIQLGCSWVEHLYGKEVIKIGHNAMIDMHNKACDIMHQHVPRNAGVVDSVVAVERYLAQNVVYDNKAWGNRKKSTSHTENGIQSGPKFGANGAFNCIMQNTCVCEGYTRGEQYLLALRGIKTSNVYCIAGEDKSGFADAHKDWQHVVSLDLPKDGHHSIIRIDDYFGLYSDPCWNAGHYQKGDKKMPYTLLTKEEISRNHTLSFNDRDWAGSVKVGRNYLAESIESNKLFCERVMSGVVAQRHRLNQAAPGLISIKGGKSYA